MRRTIFTWLITGRVAFGFNLKWKILFLSLILVYQPMLGHNLAAGNGPNTQSFIPPDMVAEKTDTIADYFAHQKNYIPGTPLNQTVKTIGFVINIWQRDDGTGNLVDNEFNNYWFGHIAHSLSHIFSSSQPPSNPIQGVDYLQDSHVRFELKGVYFHRHTPLTSVGCWAGNQLNNYAFGKNPSQRRYLNLHFTKGSCRGASGYAQFPSGRNLDEDQYIVSFMRDVDPDDEYPFWGLVMHLAHEIGHILDLMHPYDSEHCKFTHPDFLFDLFGFEKQEWCKTLRPNCDICYHQGGWECDVNDPSTTCTNNLMGGNRGASNITPLQMGRMNRALALKSVRKYAWGYSARPYLVTSDQTWVFNKKFYQDIIIAKGITLTLKGTIEMVPEASIIIAPGGELQVDGGKISVARNSPGPWKGFIKESEPKKWYQFFKRKTPTGKITIKNGGWVDVLSSE